MKKTVPHFILIALTSFVLNAQVDLNNGLVAYYPFNGNANDESGNGNNGTVLGPNLSTDRFNKSNSAYDFNGLSNYIKVNSSNTLTMKTNECSICAWITVNGFPFTVPFSPIVSKGGVERDYMLGLQYLDGKYVLWGGFSNFNTLVSTGFETDIAQWNFVCNTYNNANKTFSFYQNGKLKDAQVIASNIGQNTYPLLIGYDPYGDTEFAFGKIDEVRIYNRALNESEIQALYTENQSGLPQNRSGFYSVKRDTRELVFIHFDGSVDVIGDTKIPNISKYGGMDLDANQNIWFLNGNILYKLNNENGGIIEQHTIAGSNVGPAISFNKLNNLYILNEVSQFPEGQLAQIDLTTFANTPVSTNTSGLPSILSIEFDDAGNLWYLDECCTNKLGRLNTETGIHFNQVPNAANISFPSELDFNNGNLYGMYITNESVSNTTGFFSIDLVSGIPTQLFTLTGIYHGLAGIQCSPAAPTIGITNNQLNTTSISGFGYQWYLNNSSIVGANSNVLADQLQIGVYNVKATTGTCAAISNPFNIGTFPAPITVTSFNTVTVTVIKIITVDENGNTISGINNRIDSKNITIYPNPNNGIFSIKADNFNIGKIEISNALGSKVFETKQKEVNITAFPSGIYILKIIDVDNKLVETRKLLIE